MKYKKILMRDFKRVRKLRIILKSFIKFVKLLNKTLIKFDKYIEMLENVWREFRKMLKIETIFRKLQKRMNNFRKFK